eukprot:c3015_g1_i1.p1 GENE.c3015_g1_i1~~c3015_g1_i1.p1  ORF type:complete len:195 (+),score=35.65 c3015_g1_i1:46-585(+)
MPTSEVQTAINLAEVLQSAWSVPSPDNSPFTVSDNLPLSLRDYAIRLGTYMYCSESAWITTAVLLNRLFTVSPRIFGCRSHHKLLAACVVIGLKFTDDKFFLNTYYSECAGVSLRELNFLESTVLDLLKFRVFVTASEFQVMRCRLDRSTIRVKSELISSKVVTKTVSHITTPQTVCAD